MKNYRISEAEWEVMKVLWEQSPRTANEVVEALKGQNWSAATIRTLIGRLTRKGAVGFRKSGREYLYEPSISREDAARRERGSFLRRVYDGAVQPMVAGLLEDENLSAEDLESLRRLLDEKRRGRQ
ncbi:MAG TPA: BlaI/MecI/CopY family transcriptional regulator [Candidatus Bathyarchaeia archaeon]|nr:BlaI/MecI/CopY family transcriptional regulator [Candidatus Bathyarchaeia archaeon]